MTTAPLPAPGELRRGADRLVQRLTATSARLWWTVFAGLVLVYGASAHWYGVTVNDSMGAAWASWQLVREGTVAFPVGADIPDRIWYHEVGGRLVPDRQPGVILVAVPAQLALRALDAHPLTAVVLTAVLVTAMAMATMAVLFARLVGDRRLALAAVVALALGTGFYPNASAELWPHGPDALWLSLGMLALARDRLWWAGLAFAPAILTRPHLAVAVAAVAAVLAARRRHGRPLLALGVPAALAAGALVGWNGLLLGRYGLGGIGWSAGQMASTGGGLVDVLTNAAGSLVSPLRGLFVVTPLAALAAVVLARHLRSVPDWAQGCVVGAVAYQVVQWRLIEFTGGSGFFGYRYVLESVLLCAPAALVAYSAARRRAVRLGARLLTGLSVGTHVVGAYWYFPLRPGEERVPSAWTTWALGDTASARGPGALVLAVTALAVVTGLSCVRLDVVRRGREPLAGIGEVARPVRTTAAAPS